MSWHRETGPAGLVRLSRMTGSGAVPITIDEVRVLEGPNLYFPVPAAKLSISVEPLLGADRATR